MSKKKRGLGKGLAALLETDNVQENDALGKDQSLLEIDLIDVNPYQPRKQFDEVSLMKLVKSIQQHGVIQPVAVREKHGRYELIAGERRLRASRLAEKQFIPAVILEVNDRDSATFALIENLQREDLNVIEKAESIKSLIEEFGLTHEQCADYLGQSRSSVSNLLRLLTVSEGVKAALIEKRVDMGHARALINLSSELQDDVLTEIESRELSVRETEKLVKKLGERRVQDDGRNRNNKRYQYLASTLSHHLGVEAEIAMNGKDEGKIQIKFKDVESLKNIINVIGIDWIEPS